MDNPKAILNTHPSFLAGSYFAVLQVRKFDPTIMHHSVVRSIKNCSTARTGLEAMQHDVQEFAGEKRRISNHPVSAKKRKTKRFKNFVFFGGRGGKLFAFRGCLGT